MKAILLAGGKGTRLRPLTVHTPKPIVPIFDRPFLHYQIDLLKQVPEIDEVILSLNYQPRRIEEIFGDGGELGIGDPLRRRAGAARHRRRDPVRRRLAAPTRWSCSTATCLTQLDLAAVIALHRERKAKATIVLTPVDNPTRLRPGRDRRATETSRGSSRSRTPTRSPATPSTPASTCSSPTPSTAFPKDTPWSIERSFFPSLIERSETFVAYVYDGYWIDIGTPEKYMQVHRDIMDGHYTGKATPFAGQSPAPRGSRPTRGSRTGAIVEGPCFIDEGAVVKAGARILPYTVIGRQCHIEEHAVLDGAIVWAEQPHQPGSGRPPLDPRPQLPHRPQRARRDGVVLGDKISRHGLQQAHDTMNHRHLQGLRRSRRSIPARSTKRPRGRSARAFVAYLQARSGSASRATCGCRRRRWPRRSSRARCRRAPTSSTTG